MKKILISLILLATLATMNIHAAHQPMTQGQFLDLQTKINKDILQNPFGKETEIMESLDSIDALSGKEPWKTKAKLWAAGARKQLDKAKEAAVTKGIVHIPPAGRVERGEMPMLPAPGLAREEETPEIKIMHAKLRSPQLDFEEALYLIFNPGINLPVRTFMVMIQKSLDKGANPNIVLSRTNEKPLVYIANKTGSYSDFLFERRISPLLALLVTKGAQINNQDKNGNTVLMEAAIGNNLEMVKFLLKNNADISVTNKKGQNALHAFFRYSGFLKSESHATLNTLLEHLRKIEREDLIDAQDIDGETPLVYAMRKSDSPELVKIVERLIRAGANPLIRDSMGENALEKAQNQLKRLKSLHPNREQLKKIADQELKISLLEKYTQEWQELQRKQVPTKFGGLQAPAGKAFTEEAPLGGEPAGIVREYLLGVPEPEKKKGKAMPAKKGPVSEAEEMEEVD